MLIRLTPLAAIALLLFGAAAMAEIPAPPKGEHPPQDAAADDPEFAAFRAGLILAAKRRDAAAIADRSAPDVHLSFGGDAGQARLREMFAENPSLFHELIRALQHGATRDDDGGYSAPYWYALETPEPYDAYTTYFVPASKVIVRAGPSRSAKAMGAVSFVFVGRAGGAVEPSAGGGGYQRVRLASGAEGYIHQDFLRSTIGYRAGFKKGPNGWRMIFFVAGD